MEIIERKRSDGEVSFRIVLHALPRVRFLWTSGAGLLLIAIGALFWRFVLWEFESMIPYAIGLALVGILVVIVASSRPAIEFNKHHVRQGYRFLGICVWIRKIAFSAIADLSVDDADSGGILIRAIDINGDQLMAIEGFNSNLREAQELHGLLSPLLYEQSAVVQSYAHDLVEQPEELRPTIRWAQSIPYALVGLIIVSAHQNQAVSLLISISLLIGLIGLIVGLRSQEFVRVSQQHIVHGWVRERLLWRRHFERDVQTKEDRFGRRSLDPGLIPVAIVFLVYATTIISIASSRAQNRTSYEQTLERVQAKPMTAEELEDYEAALEFLSDMANKKDQSLTETPQ